MTGCYLQACMTINIRLWPSSCECFTNSKYYWIRKCKKWFTLLTSVAPICIFYSVRAYCTLRNGTLRNEMKSVLCEMEICTLRNENVYFANWKSILWEMGICTLRNYLYFAKWIVVLCETNSGTFLKRFLWRSLCKPPILLQSWLRHTFFVSKEKISKTWTLWVSRKLRPKKDDNFSMRVCPESLQNILFMSYQPTARQG